MKYLFRILFLGIIGLSVASCNSTPSTDSTTTTETEQKGKEYTSAYTCPMHCEGSGSEEEGTCPVCGMDYVKNEEHSHEGHDHDHNHDGHSH